MHAAIFALEYDCAVLDVRQVACNANGEHAVFPHAHGGVGLGFDGRRHTHAELGVVDDHTDARVAVVPEIAKTHGEGGAGEAEPRLRVGEHPQRQVVLRFADASHRAESRIECVNELHAAPYVSLLCRLYAYSRGVAALTLLRNSVANSVTGQVCAYGLGFSVTG